jgi:hypothetical protein
VFLDAPVEALEVFDMIVGEYSTLYIGHLQASHETDNQEDNSMYITDAPISASPSHSNESKNTPATDTIANANARSRAEVDADIDTHMHAHADANAEPEADSEFTTSLPGCAMYTLLEDGTRQLHAQGDMLLSPYDIKSSTGVCEDVGVILSLGHFQMLMVC